MPVMLLIHPRINILYTYIKIISKIYGIISGLIYFWELLSNSPGKTFRIYFIFLTEKNFSMKHIYQSGRNTSANLFKTLSLAVLLLSALFVNRATITSNCTGGGIGICMGLGRVDILFKF